MEGINVDQLVPSTLRQINESLAKKMKGHCIFIKSALVAPLDDELRVVIEDISDGSDNDHLIVILETEGGFMENVERLVSVMRAHYTKVSFVIPNFGDL